MSSLLQDVANLSEKALQNDNTTSNTDSTESRLEAKLRAITQVNESSAYNTKLNNKMHATTNYPWPNGATATNPNTGEKIIFQHGNWYRDING